MQKNNITLEDVSKEINVSRTTIYKVLNNKGKVSPEIRKKVLNAVRQYNYVPNLAAKNLALNRQYDIAFVGFHSERTPYTLNNILKGIKWAEKEFKDYGLNVIYSLSDSQNLIDQTDQIYQLAESGVRAFAIYPSHIESMKRCIDDLVDAGSFVVTVNRDVPDCKRHAYFGCDYFKSGLLAAEVLARMIPPSKKLAVLLGGEGIEHCHISARYKGLLKKMERFPTVHLLKPYKNCDGQNETLENYLTELIRENNDLGGILDLTYDLDLISRIVIKNNNKVRLVGFDLCDSVKDHMINHSIDAVIFQDMPSQGYLAIKNIFQCLVEGTELNIHPRYSKLEVVYEGNLEYFL